MQISIGCEKPSRTQSRSKGSCCQLHEHRMHDLMSMGTNMRQSSGSSPQSAAGAAQQTLAVRSESLQEPPQEWLSHSPLPHA